VSAGVDDVARRLASEDGSSGGFGVSWHGRVDLVPVDPPRYGLGYWLSAEATGKGLASAAVRALLDHAGSVLGATDVFAGVTHGNTPSEALLRRLGFRVVTDLGQYSRFHLSLARPRPVEPSTEARAEGAGRRGSGTRRS